MLPVTVKKEPNPIILCRMLTCQKHTWKHCAFTQAQRPLLKTPIVFFPKGLPFELLVFVVPAGYGGAPSASLQGHTPTYFSSVKRFTITPKCLSAPSNFPQHFSTDELPHCDFFLYKVLVSGDDLLFDLQDKYRQWLEVWPLAANRPGFKSRRLACHQQLLGRRRVLVPTAPWVVRTRWGHGGKSFDTALTPREFSVFCSFYYPKNICILKPGDDNALRKGMRVSGWDWRLENKRTSWSRWNASELHS